MPWTALCGVIEPYYPKKGHGRPPIGLERMLRIYFLQHWFPLADLACEEALYDSVSLLRFRHLLEQHKLGEQLFAEAGQVLQDNGMAWKTGTMVDAAIIAAPSSTKNANGKREPEMHRTRKGKQWCFGMKLHIGVDSQSGLVTARW